MLETFTNFLTDSGFGQFAIGNLVMIGVGLLFIWLAIKKGFEPLLLVPIGFGILIGNIPYNSQKLNLGVYDGPVSEENLLYFNTGDPLTIPTLGESFEPWERLPDVSAVHDLAMKDLEEGEERLVVMVHRDERLAPWVAVEKSGLYPAANGNRVLVIKEEGDGATGDNGRDGRYPEVIPPEKQDLWNASVMWFLFRGIEWGFYPPLIFLGVGALTDFGPLLARPKTILLGAAAQFGIFGALMLSLLLNFDMNEAASIGIIGGADGPTAIFTCTKLAPHLLGAVALAAYSYMAMVPIIQPPIMKLLTTREERLIRMEPPKEVSKTMRIVFPIAAFLLTALIANGALPLLGMLFFGNLLRECLVTDRLAKTAQTSFLDIVTILLGVTVGAKTQASNFLTYETIYIFILGIVAFSIATATGLLFAKLMNAMSKEAINPLIGAAGVSAVPMAARVVQKVAHQEDPQNFLLMHAMGPNVAGVIGSAVAAGVLLSHLAG